MIRGSAKDKTVARQLLILFTFCLLLTSPIEAQQTEGFWACPQGYEGQTVKVYNWTTYIAEDTISNFEALCGVTVVYDTFLDDGTLVDVLRAGNAPGYDVVIPIDSTMYLLLAENLLQPLDLANIPNAQNIGETFLNRARTFDPNLTYSVPYLWGTTGIGYNRTTLGYDIHTFEEIAVSGRQGHDLDRAARVDDQLLAPPHGPRLADTNERDLTLANPYPQGCVLCPQPYLELRAHVANDAEGRRDLDGGRHLRVEIDRTVIELHPSRRVDPDPGGPIEPQRLPSGQA
jgi:hypothetical protein